MRPSGLTALAVFNFIFGGLGLLTSLVALATVDSQILAFEEMSKVTHDPVPSAGLLYATILMSSITGGLLIASGIGYIGLRKVLGRLLGNGYAVVALIAIGIELSLMPYAFAINSLISFVYPLITLLLLNVIFRKDFSR